ncbi:MAG TPA: AI-2E family transporter [Candidatus Atopostipes pullistercoris]|uniref:AI-2E family transporter n=1 Tax=Candidatus Atopostipes pullistercoris TaxID=2838467 RepID=A0A9D2JXM3_9LACT|nr:AI-2E family transporter [Candidatus Atopostipes pullistercoris]
MEIGKNWRRLLSLLVIVVLIYWAVNNMLMIQSFVNALISAFQPFIFGASFAFILNLLVKRIENWLMKWQKEYKSWFRILAIISSFMFVILILFFLVFLVIPDLERTVTSFIEVVPNQVSVIIQWVNHFFDNNTEIIQFVQNLDIDLNSIQQELINYAQTFATNTLGNIVSFITGAVNSVVTIFIAIVFAFFLLTNKEKIIRQLKKVIYSIWSLKWANYLINVGQKANEIFSNFVGGAIIEAFILGILVYIGMLIFSFPFKLSISVVTGALALIPIYGAIIGGVIGFILISVVNFKQAVLFIVFIVIIQQIEGNIIYPRVVGNKVGLPSIWVMVSVTVGGSFFGLIGMLVSVPLVSVIYSLISATVNYRLETAGLNIDTDSKNL